jgi:hypothetical protein
MGETNFIRGEDVMPKKLSNILGYSVEQLAGNFFDKKTLDLRV